MKIDPKEIEKMKLSVEETRKALKEFAIAFEEASKEMRQSIREFQEHLSKAKWRNDE